MILEQDIDESTVLAELGPLFSPFYTGFEDGVSHALSVFKEPGRSFDHDYYLHTVRYNAREHIKNQAGVIGYTVKPLRNIGIEVRFRRYCIKVLKAATPLIVKERPGIPPAKTGARRRFYEHNSKATQIALPLTHDDMCRAHMDIITLVVLWEPGPAYALTAPLVLVCPKGLKPLSTIGDTINLAAIDYLWYTRIPHPATVAQAPLVASAAAYDDDLPLDRRAEGAWIAEQLQDVRLDRLDVGRQERPVNAKREQGHGQ